MRNALNAVTAELKRLKVEGVKNVSVSDETLAELRRVVLARKRGSDAVAEAVPKSASPQPQADASLQKTNIVMPRAKAVSKVDQVNSPAPAPIPPPPSIQLPEGDKSIRWAALRELVLNDPVCLSHVRPGKKVVLGVGNLDAQIMFVGEAPGADEEVVGEPFVGPAGQLLTKMIGAMALQRGDVYIGNIMNWRPEIPTAPGAVQYGNRPPTADEMAYCMPYLRAQIEVVNPALLVALGATAAQGLLGAGTFKALGEVRGSWREFAGRPLMITYHPSYILRNPTNKSKRMIWDDLLKVMERAGLPISEKQRGFFLER